MRDTFNVRLLWLLFAVAQVVLPQSALPLPDQEVLNQVRAKVLDTLDRLPRFICTQLTERQEIQPSLVLTLAYRKSFFLTGSGSKSP